MTDQDLFERRLEARLLAHVAAADRRFDAVAVASTAVARSRTTGMLGRLRHGQRGGPLAQGRVVLVLSAALLALALVGGAVLVGSQSLKPGPVTLIPPARGVFSPTGSMTQARLDHTATLLADGRVLIVGGASGHWTASTHLVSAEVWDQATDSFESGGVLSDVRLGPTATLLADDRVLVLGGASRSRVYPLLASGDIWDPLTGAFSPTGSLAQGRGYHTATLLTGGRVLVIGGHAGNPAIASAEVRDPITGAFSPTGTLREARGTHTATLLPNGSVLVVGGYDVIGEVTVASAELWDPIKGTFSQAGQLVTARAGHTATLLPDGRVLVVGGRGGNSDVIGESHVLSAEVWDPETRSFSEIDSLRQVGATTTLLVDGRVLVVDNTVGRIWDPLTGSSSATGSPIVARLGHTATLLPDGRVLVVGGDDPSNDSGELDDAIASVELFELRP